MPQKLKNSHFLLKMAKFSDFEDLVNGSENFLSLSSDWDLSRISRGKKYLLTKKIVGSARAGITKIYIPTVNPLDAHTIKFGTKLQNSYRTKVLTSFFSVGPKFSTRWIKTMKYHS